MKNEATCSCLEYMPEATCSRLVYVLDHAPAYSVRAWSCSRLVYVLDHAPA
jgi:hypothetical protein